MHIEEALTAYLLDQKPLTDLIGRRLFYDELPQRCELPAIVCLNISDVKDHFLEGQSISEEPVYQYSVYADTRKEARQIAEVFKDILSDFKGDMRGINVQKIELQNEFASTETSPDGTVKEVVVDLEYQIFYDKKE